MSWSRYCRGALDTEAAGEELAKVLRSGDIVLLSGQLGAGKTTFVKGVARGLGVVDRVTSPTFTMVRPHECHNDQGISTLWHADVYRVESLGEVLDLAAWARDAFLLAAPVKILCRDDCAGLCPECAANLNETGPGHHHERPPDSRWAKLSELKLE